MRVDGGREKQLVDSLSLHSFAITKEGIYYATASAAWGGTSQLMFYSFATKKSTLILPIGMPGFGLDVSPDGRYLVYTQIDNPTSNLMLIENFH
jgi:Tol biopolymer transport system component